MNRTKQLSSRDKAKLVSGYYWRIIRCYPRWVVGIVVAIPLTVLVNAYLPPLIIANIMHRLTTESVPANQLWSFFGRTLLLYTTIVFAGIITWRFVDYFVWRLEIRAQQDIAEEIFEHMLQRSADFHANSFSGSLVSQSNKLLGSYVRIVDTTIFQVYPMIVGIILTIVILLPKAPLYVAGLTVFSAIYVLAAFLISRPIRSISAKAASAESRQTGLLADAITNIMTVKSYARGRYERARFHRATERTRQNMFRLSRLHQRQMNTFGIIGKAISAGALVVAVVSVVKFHADIGIVFLIVSYTAATTEQLFRFGNDSMRAYNRSFGDASDMAVILSEMPEIVDPVNPEPSHISKGQIEFDAVTFVHNGAATPIFDQFNLRINAGEKIGLVGHSGAGKTSFTRLLMRFSDIDGGAIRIDGQNITAITQDDLHQAIAYVPQEPLLFHRTLAENIGYGKADATIEEIERAAEQANAKDFIATMPKGFETLVGERGVKLSGGQRQRVAIARAMLKNAPILVLDEATSALDSESEVLIQEALWKLMEGRTAIIIAHRLSTIQKMDRIIVLDEGTIVESGTHQELLAHGGTYAKLWAHQSGGFIDE